MTDGFVLKCYNDVPIVIDRYPDNSRIRALAIDAIRHPNGPRCRSLDHIWLSHLTPQDIALQRETGGLMPWETHEDWENIEKLRKDSPILLSHAAMARYYFGHPQSLISDLGDLKVEFIPKVENPDPAQLERLKDSIGDLKEVLRKAIEGAKE